MADEHSIDFNKKNISCDLVIPHCSKNILGIGAESNGSFCLFNRDKVFVSPNFGDLSYIENMDAFLAALSKKNKSIGGMVDIVARDMHPGYATREYVQKIASEFGSEVINVQHHVAHVYGCALEYGILDDDFVGIACDGTGYGTDGNIWGGEVFLGDKRIGSLEEQIMLGGDSAVINPCKMLFGIVSKFLSDDEIFKLDMFDVMECTLMRKQIDEGFNVFSTTSCGRVLDAVSALLGLCRKRTYDGEPAIALEKYSIGAEPFDIAPVIEKKSRWILNTTKLFEFIYENIDDDKKRLAATAHQYVASGLLEIAKKYNNKEIVFSGGVAYNSIIKGFLWDNGVKMNLNVAPGDYGVSFGQCAYVAMKKGIFEFG